MAPIVVDAKTTEALHHFCRMQLPRIPLSAPRLGEHLQRTAELFQAKRERPISQADFLASLYVLDWYVACACLDRQTAAWEYLFAARPNPDSDCLLVDALRARATRLYPKDIERQENAVAEFWGHLLVADNAESLPVLARYDGQRPLVPWLIRVFQNWHVSQLRRQAGRHALPEDDLAMPLPAVAEERWHQVFCALAREWLDRLDEGERLILGLRLRYRLSQRQVAHILGVHEGTVSRQTTQLRGRCLDQIGRGLAAAGWTGDGLAELIQQEMASLLMDDPRLSADALASILAGRGAVGRALEGLQAQE